MLALLADGDVFFVVRLGFGTGYVAHGYSSTCDQKFSLEQLQLFLDMYTQYIGICQWIITICCASKGSGFKGSRLRRTGCGAASRVQS